MNRFPLGDTAFAQVPQSSGGVLLKPGAGASATVRDLAGNVRDVWSAESGGTAAAGVVSDDEGDLNGYVDMPDFDILFDGGAVHRVRTTRPGAANPLSYGAIGDGVADDYAGLLAAYDALPATGGVIEQTPGIYLTSAKLLIAKPVHWVGSGRHSETVKSATVIRPAAGVTGFEVTNVEGQACTFEHLAVWSRSTVAGADDGFLIYGNGTSLRNVMVKGFGNIGVRADSTTPGAGNADNVLYERVRVTTCKSHGFFFDGGNSNSGTLIGCDATSNEGWGYYDSSFLGNAYLGCHSAGNTLGGTHTDGATNTSRFYGHYTESGQGSGNDINQPSLIFGATGDVTNIGDAPSIHNTTARFLFSQPVELHNDDASLTVRVGYDKADNGILYFSKTSEGSYFWKYSDTDKSYELLESNSGTKVAFGLTSTNHAQGPGFPRLPRGFLMTGASSKGATNPASRYVGNSDAAPTTGTWARGDILFNTLPAASGKVGWVCTTGGTPGTWKPFGAIDA